jgi:glyoxalase family protein
MMHRIDASKVPWFPLAAALSEGHAIRRQEDTMSGHHGIHHVTAISGPARRNLDFYTGTLGLRLVKKTVNFDDPGTYHFYYGDEAGRPGTILTFFPWEHAAPGRVGIGETQETALRVPEGAIGYWAQRFIEKGVAHDTPHKRFGETVLPFRDPDGMRLALVSVPAIAGEPAWSDGTIPAEHAVRGFHGVTLLLGEAAPTGAILTGVFGFAEVGREGTTVRFKADGTVGAIVDIRAAGDFLRGRQGAGSVHHIAFRAADDAAQLAMVKSLADAHGIRTTEQRDRNYFRSVYFREPGGVLFEIATDVPGFAVDEPGDALGQALKLPRFLEPRRDQIEAVLPEVA